MITWDCFNDEFEWLKRGLVIRRINMTQFIEETRKLLTELENQAKIEGV